MGTTRKPLVILVLLAGLGVGAYSMIPGGKTTTGNGKREPEAKRVPVVLASAKEMTFETILAILGGIQAQMKDDLKLIKRFSFMIAFAILVALLVIVIISASSLQFFNKALKSLKKAARRISMGEFDVLVKVKRPDELADLAVAFNEMQAAIEARDNKITEDREEMLRACLKPAEINGVEFLGSKAKVQVPDKYKALAIGRGASNIKLAGMITGLHIEIV